MWKQEIAKENLKLAKDYKTYRYPWEKDAIRYEDFRYGTHFSKAEEADILKFRQAPLPISITTAIMDTAEAMMVSSNPIIKTAPLINPFNEAYTQQSKKIAQIYDFLIKKSWYSSLGNLQYDRVLKDQGNVGHGLFYVTPRNEYGEFEVDIKHLSWKYFYPDPQSKSPFYDDMDNCIIAMEISKEHGYKLVKSIDESVARKDFEDSFVKGYESISGTIEPRNKYNTIKQGDTLPFIQRIALEEQVVYILTPKKISVNTRGLEVGFKTVNTITPEIEEKLSSGLIEATKRVKLQLTKYISIGGLGYKKVEPISKYNIIPVVYDHRDTPYPIGRISYLYPLQRALNKFIMIAIVNGSLTNTSRIIAESKSITNKDEWKMNFSVPGGVLEWSQTIPGQTKPPIIMEGKPLSDAWLRFPQYLTSTMEYVSGIPGVMMGDNSRSSDVFSTVAALQSAGGQKIKRRMTQVDAALSKVGEVTAEYYREYAPPNGFAMFLDKGKINEDPEYKVYNKLIPDKTDNTKVIFDPETDLSVGFHSVHFVSESNLGYQAGTEAALLTNLATQMKVPALIPLILKRLNIGDVDKVVDSIDIINQQGATIEQLQQVINDLESRTQILSNQVQQKSFDTETAKFKAELDKVMNEVKSMINK